MTERNKSFLLLFFKKEALAALLAVLGLSTMVGGMLFFGAVVAPLVFTQLPPAVAGRFIRTMFPVYFGYVAFTAGLGALGFLLRRQWVSVIVLGLVVVASLWAWLWLLPRLDTLWAVGDVAGFARGHRISTWLNAVELAAGLWLLVRLAV